MSDKFFKACKEGKVDEVKKMLSSSSLNVNALDKQSRTPFYIACREGHIEVVKLLLHDLRVEVNKANKGDEIPFYIACEKMHLDIVKLLLNDKRVEINTPNTFGQTPFYIACRFGHLEIVKLLMDDRVEINQARPDGFTPFYIACENGHTEVVKILLRDDRIEASRPEYNDATPLYVSCEKAHLEIVKQLIACGKDINLNAKNYEGKTALDIATRRSRESRGEYETEVEFNRRRTNSLAIVELLEAFKENEDEVRNKVRKQLGLPNFVGQKQIEEEKRKIEEEKMKLEQEKQKLSEEKKKIEEEKERIDAFERSSQEVREITYELDFDNNLFRLRTSAETFPEFQDAIRAKIEMPNADIRLHVKVNENFFILDDMRDLEDGMRIKVSIPSQTTITSSKVEHTELKNWNRMIFLGQLSNGQFRIEVDPDEIPSETETQVNELMGKLSKLKTCSRFQTAANTVFQVDLKLGTKAETAYDELVQLIRPHSPK